KLEALLDHILSKHEEVWGLNKKDTTLALRFENLILRACEVSKQKVVVLIDEYDKPLVNTLEDEALNDQMRDLLKGFYGILKSNDANTRFVMLTGVTKFSKLGIFSDLNFLTDISMDEDYAAICGITEEELLRIFEPEIKALAKRRSMTFDVALAGMKKRYDGYHFAEQSPDIYNPYSVLNTLQKRKFGYYWFETGTPTFLVKMIKHARLDIRTFGEDSERISAKDICDYRVEQKNPTPILYQAGYLTIKNYKNLTDTYVLGYPNEEVKYGFLSELMTVYVPKYSLSEFDADAFIEELYAADVDSFMRRLQALFASVTFDLKNKTEDDVQTIFYLTFEMLGQHVKIEDHSSAGSADMVVEVPDAILIFEFKLAESATVDDALQQIDDRNYAGKYAAGSRKIIKIGATFDWTIRTIKEWKTS
ncbi:MAG: ATP-binding protein, partial [Tannerella sp.]|nr:ATP-binding protein [Tannerella sp.]